MGAGADFEIDVRRGDAHLAKKNVGELLVVVLAGMDEGGLDFRMALHFTHERRDFRQVRAGPDDIQDFQSLGHGTLASIVRGQYSIREMAVQGTKIAVRAKKTLVQCMDVGADQETWVK
jgi:hypothetical protein